MSIQKSVCSTQRPAQHDLAIKLPAVNPDLRIRQIVGRPAKVTPQAVFGQRQPSFVEQVQGPIDRGAVSAVQPAGSLASDGKGRVVRPVTVRATLNGSAFRG